MHLPIVWVGKKDVGMERPSMHVLGAVRKKGIGPKKKGASPWGKKTVDTCGHNMHTYRLFCAAAGLD